MHDPLLLIAPPLVAELVAEYLRRDLDAAVEIVPSRRAAQGALRHNSYSLILLDESLSVADPAAADVLYGNDAGAPVLEINFALTGAPRMVRQVRAALVRRARDIAQARVAAASDLRGELGESLSGLLLQSELALREAPAAAANKLRHLVDLAGALRDRLRVDA